MLGDKEKRKEKGGWLVDHPTYGFAHFAFPFFILLIFFMILNLKIYGGREEVVDYTLWLPKVSSLVL